MGMSLHYRAPVTTPYLNSQSVLLSHQLVKVHVTVQLPKHLDLKPWASEYEMIMIHDSHYSHSNMMQGSIYEHFVGGNRLLSGNCAK